MCSFDALSLRDLLSKKVVHLFIECMLYCCVFLLSEIVKTIAINQDIALVAFLSLLLAPTVSRTCFRLQIDLKLEILFKISFQASLSHT